VKTLGFIILYKNVTIKQLFEFLFKKELNVFCIIYNLLILINHYNYDVHNKLVYKNKIISAM